MITILEGPDGSGKTTLGKALADKRGVTIHFGLLAKLFQNYLQATSFCDDVFCDRFYFSERVYGPVIRGVDAFPLSHERMLERVLFSKQAVVILCLPPLAACLTTFTRRQEEEYLTHAEQLKKVYAAYTRLTTNLPLIVYDYEKDTLPALRDKINALRPPVNGGPGVGYFSPGETLLVGERSNNEHFPFISTRGCSPWVAEQLDLASISEKKLYWINAVKPDGAHTAFDFLTVLQPKKIIALGLIAETWCQAAGVNYTVVPHPQYWKRFHHADHYPLIDELLGS